jgi:2-methylisocitrate lyase-like PEP mutase family enzyme
MSATPAERYVRFRALHEGPGFVMPNAWDGLSVRLFAHAGFEATATSSAALAFGLGRPDGRHQVSREEHLEHGRLLGEIGGLPVNGDFEDGYGETPGDVAATVEAAIDAGLSGIGIEDTSGDPAEPIRPFDEAVTRVRAAAGAARGRIVLTGRTDNFINGRPDLDDTILRLVAFAEAGADVLYAPGLPDMEAIGAVVAAVAPRPVNVLIGPGQGSATADELFVAGVRRISTGGALYLRAMATVRDASALVAAGDTSAARGGMSHADATALVSGEA